MHAVIAVKPGRFRDGLLALLATLPQVAKVDPVDDAPSLLERIRQCRPDLILMDMHLDLREGLENIRALHTEAPLIPCLVIADSPRQLPMARQAGADGLVLWDCSLSELQGEIGRVAP